jgi:hypothetical protein
MTGWLSIRQALLIPEGSLFATVLILSVIALLCVHRMHVQYDMACNDNLAGSPWQLVSVRVYVCAVVQYIHAYTHIVHCRIPCRSPPDMVEACPFTTDGMRTVCEKRGCPLSAFPAPGRHTGEHFLGVLPARAFLFDGREVSCGQECNATICMYIHTHTHTSYHGIWAMRFKTRASKDQQDRRVLPFFFEIPGE